MSKEPEKAPSLEELIEAALQTRPMTPEEKKKLEEEYRQRKRAKRGRKKGETS